MFVEEKYHCLYHWTYHYETVFSTDLHFTQTFIRLPEQSASEAPGRCHGVGWSPGVGLGGRLLRGPGPRGSWGMVHDGPAEQQSPAQAETQLHGAVQELRVHKLPARNGLLHRGRRSGS